MIPVVHILTSDGSGEYESFVLKLEGIRAVFATYNESELKGDQPPAVEEDSAEFTGVSAHTLKFQTTSDLEMEVDIDKPVCNFEIHLNESSKGGAPLLQTKNLPLFLGTVIGLLTKC